MDIVSDCRRERQLAAPSLHARNDSSTAAAADGDQLLQVIGCAGDAARSERNLTMTAPERCRSVQ